MMKRRSFNWCFANIFHKLFLVSVLLEHCLGFNVVEDDFSEDSINPSFYEFLEAWSIPQKMPRGYLSPTPRVGRRHVYQEKRQNMIPQPRIGRELEGIDGIDADKPEVIFPLSQLDNDRHMTPFDDKKQTGEYLQYPRSRIHPIMFRHPEVRQLILEDGSADPGLLQRVDVENNRLENALKEMFLPKDRSNKRGRTVKLIPRIGRKKRSAPDESKEKDKPSTSGSFMDDSNNGRSIWSKLKEIEDDYNSMMMDKKNYRSSKSSLMPRIGKKDFADIDEFEKRVVAFTPRIGRAALIPRIGRSDPKFRLKIRGAFIPRIGRRAALIPRIGRSLSPDEDAE